jgi:signal peptidase I
MSTVATWLCSGSPWTQRKSYIKRVIGVPGDTVEIDNGTVIVNGQPLEEDYVLNEYRDRQPDGAVQGPARRVLRDGGPPQLV